MVNCIPVTVLQQGGTVTTLVIYGTALTKRNSSGSEGQDRINEQIGSTKLPLCYSANYDIDGTFDYHNNEEIMTGTGV